MFNIKQELLDQSIICLHLPFNQVFFFITYFIFQLTTVTYQQLPPFISRFCKYRGSRAWLSLHMYIFGVFSATIFPNMERFDQKKKIFFPLFFNNDTSGFNMRTITFSHYHKSSNFMRSATMKEKSLLILFAFVTEVGNQILYYFLCT